MSVIFDACKTHQKIGLTDGLELRLNLGLCVRVVNSASLARVLPDHILEAVLDTYSIPPTPLDFLRR